jgi:hypothetical protein
MNKSRKTSVASEFNKLNFHDDQLTSVRIHPPRSHKNLTRIDFEFQDDTTGKVKVVSFRSCANFRFVMDFDVLADQWWCGTSAAVAQTDLRRITKLVAAQRRHWRTKYMPPLRQDHPIRTKLKSIRDYVLFKVSFFGGTAEILAKSYRLTR